MVLIKKKLRAMLSTEDNYRILHMNLGYKLSMLFFFFFFLADEGGGEGLAPLRNK